MVSNCCKEDIQIHTIEVQKDYKYDHTETIGKITCKKCGKECSGEYK